MVELGTDRAAGDGVRPWVTTRGVTRVVAIAVAVTATALWMSVAWGGRHLDGRSGIAAVILTGLLAGVLPLALRANRASEFAPDDGARITAVIAAALLVIGAVALADHYAVAAHFGDGTRGTFEVESTFCEQTCSWSGFFWVRQSPRDNWVLAKGGMIALAPGPGQGFRFPGQGPDLGLVPAIDVGDPNLVYPPGGGSRWAQVTTIGVAASAAACSLIAAVLVLRYRRSRRNPASLTCR